MELFGDGEIHPDHTPGELEKVLEDIIESEVVSVCPPTAVKDEPDSEPEPQLPDRAEIETSPVSKSVSDCPSETDCPPPTTGARVSSLDTRNFPMDSPDKYPPSLDTRNCPTSYDAVDTPLIPPFDTFPHPNPADSSERVIAIAVEFAPAAVTETWLTQSTDCARAIQKECGALRHMYLALSYQGQQ